MLQEWRILILPASTTTTISTNNTGGSIGGTTPGVERTHSSRYTAIVKFFKEEVKFRCCQDTSWWCSHVDYGLCCCVRPPERTIQRYRSWARLFQREHYRFIDENFKPWCLETSSNWQLFSVLQDGSIHVDYKLIVTFFF